MAENLSCYICELSQLDLKSFFHHLKVFHNISEQSSGFKCGYKNCDKVTKTKKGIREHIFNCSFKKATSIPTVTPFCNKNLSSSEENACSLEFNDNSVLLGAASNLYDTEVCGSSSQFCNVALNPTNCNLQSMNPISNIEDQMKIDFVAKLKLTIRNLIATLSVKYLANSTIDLIIKNIMSLLQLIFLYIRSNFLASNEKFMQTYTDFLDFQNEILQEIEFLSTTYRRRKAAFESVPKPQEVTLGIRFDRKFDKKLQAFIEKPVSDNMIYISLINTLKYLLNDKKIQEYVTQKKISEDGVYKDVSDGSFMKSSPFYNVSDIRILIHIYLDDFEPVNGMGYKTGIHKTTPIYFILKNLPPYLQSKLKNIHLLALTNAQDTKFYGYNNILYCLVQELKLLEDVGIEIKFLQNQNCLKGSLVALSGDYLGANGMLGMVESCRADNFCRICLIDRCDISKVFEESQVTLRTIYEHYKDVEKAEATHSIVHGVKSSCILNELTYFNTIEAPTADIMHDILEGSGQWDEKSFFNFLTKNKILNELQINDKIAAFNFGQLESTSLPNSISYDKKGVGLKAAQAWCMIRHTPLIFKSIFESNDNEELKNICRLIVLLNQIMNIIFAPKITEDMVKQLVVLIKQHHQLYLLVNPGSGLKPKHHFMVHYPSIIRKMGPLILLWCMRFEGKHLPFKKLAQSTQNFVNICKTFAFRHQEAFYFNERNFQVETTNLSYAKETDTEYFKHLLSTGFPEDKISFLTKITTSETFKKGYFVCTGKDKKTDLLIFNEIKEIFLFKNEVYLVLSLFDTKSFDIVLNAFNILKRDTDALSICSLNKLYHYSPFERLTVETNQYIVTKYTIV